MSNIIKMRKMRETEVPSREQRKKLLTEFKYKNVTEAKKALGVNLPADDVYVFLRQQYNELQKANTKKKRAKLTLTTNDDWWADPTKVYKTSLRDFKGSQVRVVTSSSTHRVVVDLAVPETTFSSWWKNTGYWFFFRYVGGDLLSTTEQIYQRKHGEQEDEFVEFTVAIVAKTVVKGKRVKQEFAEGITNCMLKPIRNWALELFENASARSTMYRYKKFLKIIDKWELDYPKGIPEEQIVNLCDQLPIEIQIYLPFNNNEKIKPFLTQRNEKKTMKKFCFINTRLDHVEHNEVVSQQPTSVSYDELQTIAADLESREEHFLYRRDREQRYVMVCGLEATYKIQNEFTEVAFNFEKESGISNCLIDLVTNRDLTMFIDEGIHFNTTVDFQEVDKQNKDYGHVDMTKAYVNFKASEWYVGFVGKVTDFRKVKGGMDFVREHNGYYRVGTLNFDGVDADKLFVLRTMGCYKSFNVYPSPELMFLFSHGVRFDIIEGCWGSRLDFEFDDDMVNGYEQIGHTKIAYYAKWVGQGCSYHSGAVNEYWMKAPENYFDMVKSNLPEDTCVDYYDGEGKISFPKACSFHYGHVTGFITMYQRLQVMEQLFQMDTNKLVRVCVDGIYFHKHEFKVNFPFRDKSDSIKLGNDPADCYASGVEDYESIDDVYVTGNEWREHYDKELFIGAGGNGKTHMNLTDSGFVNVLYVAPSWKLARSKEKEYGGKVTVLHRILNRSDEKIEFEKYYNVMVFDEASMMTEETKRCIFSMYPNCKLIFCGDIGFQLPPVGGLPMTHDGFDNVRELTENFRFRCDKHKAIIANVRSMIESKEDKKRIHKYIKDSYTNVTPDTMDYKFEDIILCSRTRCGEHSSETCNCDGRNYSEFWREKYGDGKWKVWKKTIQHSNGDVVVGERPPGSEARHGFTVHSVQGETYEESIFIDSRNLFDPTMGYTAISRAREFSQVKIVIFPEEKAEIKKCDGKLYIIKSKNTNKVYVGSTTQSLEARYSKHVADWESWKDGKRERKVSSFEILEMGDSYIELLELFPCCGKAELELREKEWINQTLNTVNQRLLEKV